MLLPSFRAFDVVVNGLPGAPKAGTLLLPVRRKKVAQMNGDNVRAYGADDSPSSWDDRRTAERSFDRSSDRYVDRSSDRYVERRDARSPSRDGWTDPNVIASWDRPKGRRGASGRESASLPSYLEADAKRALTSKATGLTETIGRRQSGPFTDPLKFAPNPRSQKDPWPTIERALPPVPHFIYDEGWLDKGFSLGFDLPMVRGLQTPHEQRGSFGFLEDRRVHDSILSLYLEAGREGLALPFPEDATPLELSAVRIPHADHHAGGISLLENHWAAGLREPVPDRSTQVDALLYAWHASERDRARREDWTVLLPAMSFPGPEGRFVVRSGRTSALLQTRAGAAPVDAALWRELALRLARRCGIETVASDWVNVMGTNVLFLERYDRDADGRAQLTLSGETLGGDPKAGLSYLGLADILNSSGAEPAKDLPRIWRRMVFSHLCGADADVPAHWQFIRSTYGWKLAPAHAFSIAPPGMNVHRPITVDGKQTLKSADDAVSLAPYFGMKVAEAKAELSEMRKVMLGWERLAFSLGADPRECALMAPVLDDV